MKTVKRVIITNFIMPFCCRECEFECISDQDPSYEKNLPPDVIPLPRKDELPFCAITLENIYDDRVVAVHCRLKEVDVIDNSLNRRKRIARIKLWGKR